MTPRPKALIVNFPSNPTTECVDLPFLARLVELAREHGFHLIHDLAYADIAFDGYKPALRPAGPRRQRRRRRVLHPLQELQHARLAHRIHGRQPSASSPPSPASRATSTTAPSRPSRSPPSPRSKARRSASARSATPTAAAATSSSKASTSSAGPSSMPKATMFVWAQIPEPYRDLGSLEFSKLLLDRSQNRRQSRHRLRRPRRQPRPLRPNRERRTHPPGPPRHQANASERRRPRITGCEGAPSFPRSLRKGWERCPSRSVSGHDFSRAERAFSMSSGPQPLQTPPLPRTARAEGSSVGSPALNPARKRGAHPSPARVRFRLTTPPAKSATALSRSIRYSQPAPRAEPSPRSESAAHKSAKAGQTPAARHTTPAPAARKETSPR